MTKEKDITKIIQTKQLQMLIELNELLSKAGVEYYLACGTLLGCIRHSGFIPWDDDVDIYIKGKDYNKLRQAFISIENETELELHDFSTQRDYPYPFPKIVARNTFLREKMVDSNGYKCGLYIDVFLLSDVSNNRIIRFIQEKKRYCYYCLLRSYYHRFTGIKSLIGKITKKTINVIKINQKMLNCCKRDIPNAIYTVDTGVFGKQAFLKKESFSESVMRDFCGYSLPVPKGFQSYLTDYYGDYMQLPPEDKRTSGHTIDELIIDGEII